MQPIVTTTTFREIDQRRYQRPLFILDLAVPRDFEAAIGEFNGVYLCSVDDLRVACERNRKERKKNGPARSESSKRKPPVFMTDLQPSCNSPTIKRLKTWRIT